MLYLTIFINDNLIQNLTKASKQLNLDFSTFLIKWNFDFSCLKVFCLFQQKFSLNRSINKDL
jgi:hypothetical protein